MAKNISAAWEMARRQVFTFIGVFLTVSLLAALVTLFAASRILKSLKELRVAAASISRGELGSKVAVCGRDEIAQVGTAFNQMSEQVEKQVDGLQLLVGALAHEMKTPITSVIGYADSLMHVQLPVSQQEIALEQIYSAGMRMEQMSAKMLQLIGLYENEAIEMKAFSAAKLFEHIWSMTQDSLGKKSVLLSLKCPPKMVITGDQILLASLFSNLVLNSCKASNPGDSIDLEGENRTIRVTDHGCGISKDALPYVTKAFYMADKSRSRNEGGVGTRVTVIFSK